MRAALDAAPPSARIVKKIDSLLRGNLAAEIGVLAAAAPVVLDPGLPVAGRTVRDGVVQLSGVPLHETDAWRVEPGPAPSSVGAALGSLRTTVLGVDAVRGDTAAALAAALDRAPVVICDALTDDDLDAVAAAALARPDVVLAGSGGFAAAIGRSEPVSGYECSGTRIHSRPSVVLVVVGSAAEIAARQVERLLADGAREIRLPSAGETLGPGVTVLRPGAVTGATRGPSSRRSPARSPTSIRDRPPPTSCSPAGRPPGACSTSSGSTSSNRSPRSGTAPSAAARRTGATSSPGRAASAGSTRCATSSRRSRTTFRDRKAP
ncbi:hypothetical protein BJF90_35685 [Pseudonocardia sp. CNS-004]|nr:hypothetical protein BJF90_35685 [Pseudonocardia sp. CNS-004]